MTDILKSLLYYVLMLSAFALMIFTIGCANQASQPIVYTQHKIDAELREKISKEMDTLIRNFKNQLTEDGHPDIVSYMQKVLHNPKSFDHISTRIWKKSYRTHDIAMIRMDYRAENGFGATRKFSMDFQVTRDGALKAIRAPTN